MIEQPKPKEKPEWEIVLINPKTPNYEGVVLGIEITSAGFTGPNLDHHGEGYTSDSPSAIEQALNYDISSLPSGKIGLVKPDPDSVGAIAVLMLRKEGRKFDETLVRAIGLADRKGPGVFNKDGASLLGVSEEEFERLKKLVAVARYKIVSQRAPLLESLDFMKRLLTGQIDEREVGDLYAQDQKELEEAKRSSEVVEIKKGNNTIVVVTSQHSRAFDIGYGKGNVVIAYNPQFKWPNGVVTPKFTIARYDSNVPLDIRGLLEELNKLDEGWGGSENIIGSPQQRVPKITLDELKEIVATFVSEE
ncbi:MAG: hypothetical protein NZ822_02210 [Patescibacteria group bacterium]|nr:hypothetical protein [Patescibacteria group bacterium]